MNTLYTLCSLDIGESGTVLSASGSRSEKRLSDVGLIAGTKVSCVGKSPQGDMSAFLIRGAIIAIRSIDCQDIEIEKEEKHNGID